ncbi:hypothetical protein D3C73_1370290 [compost metagenome]
MQLALHPFAQVDVAKHHIPEHHTAGAARHQGQAHAGVDQGQDGQRRAKPLHVLRRHAGRTQHAGQQFVEGRVGRVRVHEKRLPIQIADRHRVGAGQPMLTGHRQHEWLSHQAFGGVTGLQQRRTGDAQVDAPCA